MNDDELITVLQEQRGKISMNTPVEQIISRGRAARARRRLPGVAVGLGAAAATAFALTSAQPASHPAGAHDVKLAAWTVVKQADGAILVTISELKDPAGLQSTLRADGVPASVSFAGQENPACQGYVFGGSQSQRRQLLTSIADPAGSPNGMVIHPAAIPSGAGLQISALFQNGQGSQGLIAVSAGLVQASLQCTGS
jgi:hypothetical protein